VAGICERTPCATVLVTFLRPTRRMISRNTRHIVDSTLNDWNGRGLVMMENRRDGPAFITNMQVRSSESPRSQPGKSSRRACRMHGDQTRGPRLCPSNRAG